MADELSSMRNAAWRAMAGIKRTSSKKEPRPPVPRKRVIHEQRDRDLEVKAEEMVSDLLNMQIKCMSLLHDIGEVEFPTIDRLFGLPTGTSARMLKKYPSQWRDHTLRHSDNAIAIFYKSKISIVEHLLVAAPNTIAYLREQQDNIHATRDQRFQAGKEIREWTSLFFRNRQSRAARDLLDPDMKKAAEEADNMDEMLGRMMQKGLGDVREN